MSKTIQLASLLYGFSILLSRLIGLIRESVIGRILGAGAEADVYWMAFILPDFLNYLLAGGALALVFIPLLQNAQTRGGVKEKWACFWRIATPLSCLVCGLTFLLWINLHHLAPWIAPGFTPAQHHHLIYLMQILLPAQIFHLIGGLLSATLQAQDRHLAPALAPLIYTGWIVGCGIILGPSLGAEGFAWGVLLGSIFGPFGAPLLGIYMLGKQGDPLQGRPCWEWRHEDVKAYLWRTVPIMLGFSVVVLDEMMVKRLGSEITKGSVAQLHYARTLMKVPMGVFGLAMGMATFPTLSRLCAQGNQEKAYTLLVKAIQALLVLACLSQIALTCSAQEMAYVIWGSRLSEESAYLIGLYCGGLSIGLWAWSLQGLVARGFYAQGNTWVPTLIGSIVMGCMWPIYELGAQRGGWVLTLISSLSISIYVMCLWWGVSHSLGGRMRDLILPLIFCGLMVVGGIWPVWKIENLEGWFLLDQFLIQSEFSLFWRSLGIGGLKSILGISFGIGIGLILRFRPLLEVFNLVKVRFLKKKQS